MPNHLIDRTGETYGYLTVLKRSGYWGGKTYWQCKCVCGVVKDISTANLPRQISCGCAKRSALGVRNSIRRKTDTISTSPEYRSWKSMIQRCGLESSPNFHLYGGRGIKVCDRWKGKNGFSNFMSDMGKRPVGTSLDRTDTNGNYEPSNCTWADAKAQARNRRDTPEYAASRKAALARGLKTMWSDPEVRARLLESRRKSKAKG